ncbi:bifunctional methylenetetrahydrofolate dehydrogenase/methenyltetrahydrofolate cyclohydrolase [candidate division WWE3 bacterium CG08_land_8_20_14_0_20_41_15]|uniref:Bifunctional protein FolD n=2 Tax=Katanobacteria TaxID=422282 RepID=A0A2H0XA81_UNCKA|nr:MAG: bifunctional methylenetetrahydrofolate dehydrogenase/methenyltetrahydrofolate cyclohydrolase [candidate division WWE3 bacterium CG08_land_8_20_14_0_20_41_15]
MKPIIVDGKKIAEEILDEVKDGISKRNLSPSLHVILAGTDPASLVYVKKKEEACKKVGVSFFLHQPNNQSEILSLIKKLNEDSSATGILVQLPLPEGFSQEEIIQSIDPKKDVDGLTAANLGFLFSGNPKIVPATVVAVSEILKRHNVSCFGKKAVVVGRSVLVGLPVFALLKNLDATVTLCHSKTKDLKKELLDADIVVSAVGKRGIITKEMVKDGVVVIGCGIVREENKVFGDVFSEVSTKASVFTPVPGGVGPMTVACLLKNLVSLASNK